MQHLPSKAEAEQLAGEYFRTVNQVIPLFDQGPFMRQLRRQYSWNPDESPSWWISLNVVLSMSYRERAQGSSDGGGDLQRSLGHVKNALNVVVELFMRTADLSATQGLLESARSAIELVEYIPGFGDFFPWYDIPHQLYTE